PAAFLHAHSPPLSLFPRPPTSTHFPYTTLFRSPPVQDAPPRRAARPGRRSGTPVRGRGSGVAGDRILQDAPGRGSAAHRAGSHPDRKSTRLNSSHVATSYAVFCLKKKKRYTHKQ